MSTTVYIPFIEEYASFLMENSKIAQAADIKAAKELAAQWTEKEDERY
ncbi:MAG: hypothetical protein FWG59_07030 [Betaproteobacteria bacterium]|nr:hypothetical protein [Betaproteobacteria bacterium]